MKHGRLIPYVVVKHETTTNKSILSRSWVVKNKCEGIETLMKMCRRKSSPAKLIETKTKFFSRMTFTALHGKHECKADIVPAIQSTSMYEDLIDTNSSCVTALRLLHTSFKS